MPSPRSPRWPRRAARLSLSLGILLLLLCAASFIWYVIYQQPPGSTFIRRPDGTLAQASPPPGKLRIRFIAGSLIIAHGDLPPTANKVRVHLGYMKEPGLQVSTLAHVRQVVASPDTWKYHFYREHIQIQVLPLAAFFFITCFVLSRGKPAWACQSCGYDLRGTPTAPCPECGHAPAAT